MRSLLWAAGRRCKSNQVTMVKCPVPQFTERKKCNFLLSKVKPVCILLIPAFDLKKFVEAAAINSIISCIIYYQSKFLHN